MFNENANNESNINNFFHSFERIMVLFYLLLSFILNIIIVISICLIKNKKISIIMRIASSILGINFINIFTYSFQWVLSNNEISNGVFQIELLLVEKSKKSNTFYACNLQSFFLLFTSLSQDYLIILLFFIVYKNEIIKPSFINVYIVYSIIFPIIISIIFLCFKAFGINDDFCFIKKYEKKNSDNYKVFDAYKIYYIIIYFIRGINFSVIVFLLIKIILYIKKEKSLSYIINKLSMLFIQLFKLFIILIYRITSMFYLSNPLRIIYIIFSTIDGLLIPLAFSFSNDIYSIFCRKIKSRRNTETEKDFFEETKMPNASILPNDDLKCSIFNSNNFDLSF